MEDYEKQLTLTKNRLEALESLASQPNASEAILYVVSASNSELERSKSHTEVTGDSSQYAVKNNIMNSNLADTHTKTEGGGRPAVKKTSAVPQNQADMLVANPAAGNRLSNGFPEYENMERMMAYLDGGDFSAFFNRKSNAERQTFGAPCGYATSGNGAVLVLELSMRVYMYACVYVCA